MEGSQPSLGQSAEAKDHTPGQLSTPAFPKHIPQKSNTPVWTYFNTTTSELLIEHQCRFELIIRLVRSAYSFSIVVSSSILQAVFHVT